MPSTDLSIYMTYLTKSDLSRTGESLFAGEKRGQPGWYVRSYRDEGYSDVLKYTRLTAPQVEQIARFIDQTIDPDSTVQGNLGKLASTVKSVNTLLDRRNRERLSAVEQQLDDLAREREQLIRDGASV